jgi:nickel-dependent lactate racemase
MKSARLPYGETGIEIPLNIPGVEADLLLPRAPVPLPDPKSAFLSAVREPHGGKPLAEVAKDALAAARSAGRLPLVTIVIADHTRPVPDRLLVPWLAAEIGVPDHCITVLVGTGTHRGSTPEELEKMLGDAASRFRVINHNCENIPGLVFLGKSSCGGECWMNRLWVEADLRLATGFIEPHFYAGFSGGSKAVIPGIAGLETVRHFHRAALIAQPSATWTEITTNPLQQLTREMTAFCPPHFIVNVTLDPAKRITGFYAGDVARAHDAGCAAAHAETAISVKHRYPVVLTTNSGYPLDQNFYQTVKGISAAARIVEKGGVILIASRCNLGLPPEGDFATILADPRTDADLHLAIQCSRSTRHDQWQVQTLLQCLEKARVLLYSELSQADRQLTRTEHCDSIEQTLARLARESAKPLRVAILPQGPLSVPTLSAQ